MKLTMENVIRAGEETAEGWPRAIRKKIQRVAAVRHIHPALGPLRRGRVLPPNQNKNWRPQTLGHIT